jgi:hypothetical protein
MIPLSVLGALRKELIAKLDDVRTTPPRRSLAEPNAIQRLLADANRVPLSSLLAVGSGQYKQERRRLLPDKPDSATPWLIFC